MRIRNLYQEYFEERLAAKGYADEAEYWKDLFRLSDMLLSVACILRIEITKGENQVRIDNLHLRGTAVNLEEILREISSDKAVSSGDEEGRSPMREIPREDVRRMTESAVFHIRSRLQFSGEKWKTFRLTVLFNRLELSELEKFAAVLSMMACDQKYQLIFMYIQGDVRMKYPTAGLILSLWELSGRNAEDEGELLDGSGRLFRYVVDTYRIPEMSAAERQLQMHPRIYSFLHGYEACSDDLALYADLFRPDDGTSEELLIRQDMVRKLTAWLTGLPGYSENGGSVINLYGPPGIGKRFLIRQTARTLGVNILFVDACKLYLGNLGEVRKLMRRIGIESIVTGSLVCFCSLKSQIWEGQARDEGRFFTRPPGLEAIMDALGREYGCALWASLEQADYLLDYDLHVMRMELPMLSAQEKMALWQRLAREYRLDKSLDLKLCAGQYVLSTRGVEEVLRTADLIRLGRQGECISREDIRCSVAQQSANQLGHCANLVKSVYTWNDLVVSHEQRRLLDMICNQVKYRSIVGEEWGFHRKTAYGRGVCALFYGSPGTGKTMAAQVIANDLGLDLYRVDLSRMVSKYIGETEKNISDLFARVKNINALLFFDEADALFAKRSEVRDSNDRNANSETAHLLQKLEDFEGIAILATNYINNIDDAFKRRIQFMVKFRFPDARTRLKLWKTLIPEEVPKEEELNFEYLAETFEMSGSSIKEALTGAAYLAAAEGSALANRHLVEAVKVNFAKYGKILTDEDFGYLAVQMGSKS